MRLDEVAAKMREKAAFMPYVIENDEPAFLFMVPSNVHFGGDRPQLAKGGIDAGENAQEGAVREAEEELGLKRSNIKPGTIRLAHKAVIQGQTEKAVMHLFIAEVKNKKNFDQPHYETGATFWLTLEQFKKEGRQSQLPFVEAATAAVKEKL